MRNNLIAQKRGRFCCSSGDPIHVLYSPFVQSDGTIRLEAVGEENTDEKIESFAQSCSIEAILNRYINGDTDALNVNVPMYLDLTQFPKTYAEVLQLGIDAELRFNNLPAEVKRKFDNNWRVWLSQTGSEEWFRSFGVEPKTDSGEDPVDPQPKEGEDK